MPSTRDFGANKVTYAYTDKLLLNLFQYGNELFVVVNDRFRPIAVIKKNTAKEFCNEFRPD